MTSIKVRLNLNRKTKDAKHSLVFQIIHRRIKKVVYAGISVNVNEFDLNTQRIKWINNDIRKKSDVKKINLYLRDEIKKIESIVEHLQQRGLEYTATDITLRYKHNGNNSSLLLFIEHQIDHKMSIGKVGSAETYRKTKASLERYTNRPDILFSDIDVRFVHSYEQFLQTNNISANTICYYMRNLKSIYNKALTEGYIGTDGLPFRSIQTRPRQTIKRAISRDYLRTLADLPLGNKNLEMTRDLFLFSFYTRGMSFVDIAFLKKRDVVDNVIIYQRHKTGQTIKILVTKQIQTIIDTYTTDSDYVFPIVKSLEPRIAYVEYQSMLRRINRQLKTIGQMSGINIPLSTYVSRHSWATQARELGAPVSVISEGLGHTSEKTTQIYLKQFDQRELDKINQIVSEL